MKRTQIGLAAAGVIATGGLVLGAANAYAATDAPGTTSPSTSSSSSDANRPDRPEPHKHTAVTGTEKDKVVAAVKAKDSTITVTEVRKDPDGSYDALGTKSGNRVMVEVSKDLKTVEAREGRGPGGPGGRHGDGKGRHAHTAVTGTEKDKVVAAVKAKDSTVTVTDVRKDADGSYDALGTKSGERVMVEVSKDLKTVEVRTGGPGGPGGKGDRPAPPSGTQQGDGSGGSDAPSSSSTTPSSNTTT